MTTEHRVIALVRSDVARQNLMQAYPSLRVHRVDYTNTDALGDVLSKIDCVVHLAGIIKESRSNTFAQAHEQTCAALASACQLNNIQSVIYPSIVGAAPGSANTCLRSKALAEKILLDQLDDAKILRLPMILGAGDHAAFALRHQASRHLCIGFRTQSLEQPIYAGDVVKMIICLLQSKAAGEIIELAGPEVLSRCELIKRAAVVLGRRPVVISLPFAFALVLAVLWSWLPSPPFTRAMLGVLDQDDRLDVTAVCARFKLKLTPLDEMLRLVL